MLTNAVIDRLHELETSLWVAETRFDDVYMERVFAPDFMEFGRSGRVYQRHEMLGFSGDTIDIALPLQNFQARQIAPNVVLITYLSQVTYDDDVQSGNRSSLWVFADERWQLTFHQGTPTQTPTAQ